MMKVLFVASFNKGYYAPFIVEQAEALRNAGCDVEFFGVTGKGIKGYIKALPALRRAIRDINPDVVHAHYGLCGLLAGIQRSVPVVTTFHGSDINEKSVLPFSKLAMMLSRHNIFVSQKLIDIAKPRRDYSLIPCGIDLTDLQLTDKATARHRMGLDPDKKYVLFAGAFDNPVKNSALAKEAMKEIPEAELIELKGYSREQVTLLMCAADVFLMTSHTEGSPQVIKEAMACGCPIVSVDVGDVKSVMKNIAGCLICAPTPEEIANNIQHLHQLRTLGRMQLQDLELTNSQIIPKLIKVYSHLASTNPL